MIHSAISYRNMLNQFPATTADDIAAHYPDPVRMPGARSGPLADVTVTDFGWMGVGSLASRLLADFGARVIRIENRNRLDMPRRLPFYKGGGLRSYGEEDANPDPNKAGNFNNYNRNKLGITLNMTDPDGRRIAEELIAESSVLTENFAPGVMERWGLDEAHVRSLRPDIVYARMSGFGQSGPYAHFHSFGPVVQAMSGLSQTSGLPAREPSGYGLSYMDNQAAYYAAAAVLLALLARTRTGHGTDIDLAATEAGIELLGPLLLDADVNGVGATALPTGNRLDHPLAAPHGVYPSRGTDRWVTIAVFSDTEWARLRDALGRPAWATDPRYDTVEGRVADQDELDARLAEWTRTRDRHETMELLQAAGVRAGAVQTAEDINETDPQIAFRGTFFELDHPVIGPARFEGVPFRASQFAADNWRSAPLLGEDTYWVLRTVLGRTPDEIEALERRGVI